MEVKGENDKTVTFGAIADSVQEVIELAGDEIEPSPKFGNSIAAQFIKGIGKKEDNFIIILNMDQIFSNEEIIDCAWMIFNECSEKENWCKSCIKS